MNKLQGIDAALHRYYGQEMVSKDLVEAILYSVDAGGKRLRPILLLDILEGFGLELTDAHFDVAAALEMIHTGSLIHDDLPAMDDDDYRRGRLTNHKKYDEATAILAGDSLFLDPFGLIAATDLPSSIKIDLIHSLSLSSGTFGMVSGQMLDMKGEGKAVDLAQLSTIHSHKTGKLLAFPFKAAGIMAQQDEQIKDQLCQAGFLLGHAFQVRDDILDVTATFDEIGKTPRKDLLAEKSTYPSLLGLEQSYQVLSDSLDQVQAIFTDLQVSVGFKPEAILEIIEGLRLDV